MQLSVSVGSVRTQRKSQHELIPSQLPILRTCTCGLWRKGPRTCSQTGIRVVNQSVLTPGAVDISKTAGLGRLSATVNPRVCAPGDAPVTVIEVATIDVSNKAKARA